MKKVISIFLLLCLIVPFAGTVSWFHYQKKSIKKQIKHQIIAGIDKDELVLFTFTIEETKTILDWEHSKEFEYNNNMYDIVKADTIGNRVNYWCWWDHKETKLNKHLTKLLTDFLGEDNENKETKVRFANFYLSLFHTNNQPWTALKNNTSIEFNFEYIVDYTSLQLSPPTPPPNLG